MRSERAAGWKWWWCFSRQGNIASRGAAVEECVEESEREREIAYWTSRRLLDTAEGERGVSEANKTVFPPGR